MSRRRQAVLATAGVALAVAVSVPVIASGAVDASVDRVVAAKQEPATAKRGAASLERITRMNPSVGRACSLSCTQRVLVSLIKKHNKLARQFKKLQSSYYNCETLRDVTQYGGYDYQGFVGAATALDFTTPGDPVSERMIVWVC